MPYKSMLDSIFEPMKKRDALKLARKGDQVVFRLAKSGFYFEGLHFLQGEDKKYSVTHCARVETGEYCELCEKFFEAKNAGDESGQKAYKSTINVFYIILDRKDSTTKVLQTTQGVKRKIDFFIGQWKEAGKDISDFDLKLTRTEIPGSYYDLSAIDSALSVPLSDTEKEELLKAKEASLQSLMDGEDKIELSEIEEF